MTMKIWSSYLWALTCCINIAEYQMKSIKQEKSQSDIAANSSFENETSPRDIHDEHGISSKPAVRSDTEQAADRSRQSMVKVKPNKTLQQEKDDPAPMAQVVGDSKQAEERRHKEEATSDTRDSDDSLDVIPDVSSGQTTGGVSETMVPGFTSGFHDDDDKSTAKFASIPDKDPPTMSVRCREDDDQVSAPLTQLSGRIEWTHLGDAANCSQSIDVGPSGAESGLGLVIHFLRLDLRRGSDRSRDDTVHVYQGVVPADGDRKGGGVLELRRVQGGLPVSPVLVYSGQATLRLTAYRGQHNGTESGRTRPPMRSSVQIVNIFIMI